MGVGVGFYRVCLALGHITHPIYIKLGTRNGGSPQYVAGAQLMINLWFVNYIIGIRLVLVNSNSLYVILKENNEHIHIYLGRLKKVFKVTIENNKCGPYLRSCRNK